MTDGVHRTHCCLKHGCKYSNKDCPVANSTIIQDYPCEMCSWEGEELEDMVEEGRLSKEYRLWYHPTQEYWDLGELTPEDALKTYEELERGERLEWRYATEWKIYECRIRP